MDEIKTWVARNEFGSLWLHWKHKPIRGKHSWIGDSADEHEANYCCMLPRFLFPSVKWEDDEPTEVEITIKPKVK